MRRSQAFVLIRMSVGSVVGIMGFGTLSFGFVDLSVPRMLFGVVEILAGTFLALGVMAPLRKSKRPGPGATPK